MKTNKLLLMACGVFVASASAGAGELQPRLSKASATPVATKQRVVTMQHSEGQVTYRRIPANDLDKRNLKLMYKEDFSKFTEGSEESPVLMSNGWLYLDEITDQPGWVGKGMGQAGGCAGLLIKGVDNIQGGGALNAPLDNYAGTIIIKFRARLISGKEGYLFVNMCAGGFDYPGLAEDTLTEQAVLKPEDGWQDIAIEMTNHNTATDGFVQINGVVFNGDGFLIDDVEIYRDMDVVLPPQKSKSFDFKRDGFSATWDDLPMAESYLVDIYQEHALGTENITGTEDFDNISTADGKFNPADTPEGWDIHLEGPRQTTSDMGADNSPAIVLSCDEDYITLPLSGTYTKLEFFMRPCSNEAAADNGQLIIELLNPSTGKWKSYGALTTDAVTVENGYTIRMSDFEREYPGMYDFSGLYTQVRLHLRKASVNAAMAMDHFVYETNPARERTLVRENIPADKPEYTFTGLNPDMEHYYVVKTCGAAAVSEPSTAFHAFGISPVTGLAASDIDPRGGVTATWDATPRADKYIVGAYTVNTIDADQSDYTVLEEDFSKVDVRNPAEDPQFLNNENSTTSLDEYTGTPGWKGRGNVLAKGMLGCLKDPYAMFELYSPEISLHNNEGNYYVDITAYSEEGASLIVQGNGVYETIKFDKTGSKKATLHLSQGIEHDQLMFYTAAGQQFLIDDIQVYQDVKKGDQFFTLMDKTETTDNTYRFSISPEEGLMYGLQVQAFQTLFNKTCKSELSPIVVVDFFSNSIEDNIAEKADFEAVGRERAVQVSAGERAVSLYDTAGRMVGHVEPRSSAAIAVPAGIYIATDGVTPKKVMPKH